MSGSEDEYEASDAGSYDSHQSISWEEEEAKQEPQRLALTALRFILFFVLAPIFSIAAMYLIVLIIENANLFFPSDFTGRKTIAKASGICFGISAAAGTTWLITYMIKAACGIRSGLQETFFNWCPRCLTLTTTTFGTMALGTVLGWNLFVSEAGLNNPIFWACVFAFGWAALGLFVGACCSKMWHVLYIFFFLANFFTWPIVCRFTVSAPKAQNMWHLDYPPFPLNSPTYLREYPLGDERRSLELSPVPDSPRACNFSCEKGATEFDSAEMNFPVNIRVNNKDLGSVYNSHVLYPVLLMSADFTNWHVAADRNQATPDNYFRSTTKYNGLSFRAVIPSTLTQIETTTTTTTEAPQATVIQVAIPTGGGNPAPGGNGGGRLLGGLDAEEDGAFPRRLPPASTTTTGPPPPSVDSDSAWLRPNVGMYMVACVVTDENLLNLNKNEISAQETKFTTADMLARCSAVDGVCGYPCNQNYVLEASLPSCLDSGKIDLARAFPTRTDKDVNVNIRSCIPGTTSDTTPPPGAIGGGGPGNCQASTAPFSGWSCPSRGFPPMEVVARNVIHDNVGDIRPHVFMFATTASLFQASAADPALLVWERYNRYTILDSQPQTAAYYPGYPMTLIEDNQLSIRPSKCYTKAGPLYMVACAVNASQYDTITGGKRGWPGKFTLGQKVAPPPFNDRCVAVAGRCGLACQKWDRTTGTKSPLIGTYCGQDGVIPQHLLVGEIQLQTNWGPLVCFMVFVLILGYFQRVLSGLPGLFCIYKQHRFYLKEMTSEYKYIAIATPSMGEDKICAMRNIIGTTSAYPPGCECPYHIIFLDEGHRHAYKGMFLSYVDFIAAAVAQCVLDDEKMEKFMVEWAKDTRDLRMEDQTEEYYKRHGEELELKKDDEKWKKYEEEKGAKYFAEKQKADGELMDKVCGRNAWGKVFKERQVESVPQYIAFRREMEIIEPGKKKVKTDFLKGAVPVDKSIDDVEECTFNRSNRGRGVRPQLNFHYIGRAKLDSDDSQVLETQHVTVGMPYYNLPDWPAQDNTPDSDVKHSLWLQSRKNHKTMMAHLNPEDAAGNSFRVPLATSRGKAGALNFASNYLYLWHLANYPDPFEFDPENDEDEAQFRPGLFSIADCRHQYQPAFITSCMPYFFKEPGKNDTHVERDAEVAFTQVPQFFPEIEDEKDFLDNNNAMYFRINGTIRNCCGGASSCGANGTWQLGDPRDDHKKYGLEKEYFTSTHWPEGWDPAWNEGYVWEVEPCDHVDTKEEAHPLLGPRKQLKERSIFHESCKIEDTASSLMAVLRGQRSQYVNMRLSYAMTKAPVGYLAAVQRWAEGAVVLMLQTYIDMPIHTKNPCLSKLANILVLLGAPAFIAWTCYYVYGSQYDPLVLLSVSELEILQPIRETIFGDKGYMDDFASLTIVQEFAPSFQEHVSQLFLLVLSEWTWWIGGILWFVLFVYVLPTCAYACCRCLTQHRGTPVWPHVLSAWARLAIIMDNLTYWLFFFTAFFWVFFNAYTAFTEFLVSFSTKYFYLALIILTSLFHYAQLVTSMIRATNVQRDEGNAVLSISIDNIWRQTQLYYINAPLQLYAIFCGIQDYIRQRSYGVDLSFWKGGDRGAFTSQIVKCWLSTMVIIAIAAVIWQFVRPDPNMTSVIATIILCLSAMDVLFPCIYLTCGDCPEQYQKDVMKYKERKMETIDDEVDEMVEELVYNRRGSGDDPSQEELKKYKEVARRRLEVAAAGSSAPGCCAPLWTCFSCGETKDSLPFCMRFVTCSWWGSCAYTSVCMNPCVIGFLKYVGVVKEFLVPAGVAVAIFAQGTASSGSDDGTAALLQLVAAGFTGAH